MRAQLWTWLILGLMGCGLLQVAQQNALLLGGYAVGDRLQQVHAAETRLAWLTSDVSALTSPVRLAQEAEQRHLKLIAWSRLPAPAAAAARGEPYATVESAQAGDPQAPSLVRVVARAPEAVLADDTRD